jgi:beta-lactamase regulating signal transducer with metallopeptidase domain
MTVPDLQPVAQAVASRLLNTAVEGILLACLVWALLRLMGRQNSGTRFAIWFSALLAIVALPFFSAAGLGAAALPDMPLPHPNSQIVLASAWAFCLFVAWAAAASLLLLRLGLGFWRLRKIRSNCFPVDALQLDPAIVRAVLDFESERRVEVCVSNDLSVPAALGFFRPAIVFPAWPLPQLSPTEIKVILLHELAHLQRRDDWTNLLQKIVKALFFFHPAVWWIESRLTLEREMACDDAVLAQTASPKAYASSLISFAEKLQRPRGLYSQGLHSRSLALAQTLVTRMRQMSLRVTRILDSKRPARTGLWKPVLALGAVLLAVACAATPYAPRLVAFENQSQQNRTPPFYAISQANKPAALQAQVVPDSFNMRGGAGSLQRRKAPPARKLAVLHARSAQREDLNQDSFVIVQTTQYDSPVAGVWTLCIWRVRGNSAQRQLRSTIILNWL